MRAEIIAIGTELLMGDVINSNAAWLSKELASLGVDIYYHHTVGDNPERIQGVLKKALDRAEFIIFTGGLGPTDDDLTVATLADYFDATLVEDPHSAEKIKNYFIARDMPMSKLNLKQALKPADAITIQNPVGTAPGILWDVSQKVGKQTVLMTFPGVPKELYAMWPQGKEAIRHAMKAAGLENQILVTSFLKFFGIGESKLAELLRDLMQSPSPTVAPYVGEAEVKIRVSCKGFSEEQARKEMQPVKEEIIRRCQPYFFGEDEETLPSCVGKLLTSRNQSVSLAESCTGGLVSSRLTDVPGSSRYVHYNVVAYANEQKTAHLGVPADLFETVGSVSAEVAEAMALGMLKKSGSDWAVSLTGIAGPGGGTEEKPVGLVYIGIAQLDAGEAKVWVKKMLVNQKYQRADIKYWFSQYALFYLKQALCGDIPTEDWQVKDWVSISTEPSVEYSKA